MTCYFAFLEAVEDKHSLQPRLSKFSIELQLQVPVQALFTKKQLNMEQI